MKKIALAVFGVYLLFGFTSVARAWESNLVGSGKFSFGYGLAVKVDSGGSVVAAGALSNSGGDLDFIVLKFGSNGNELWRKAIRGTASGSGLATTNEAKALAIAGDGSIAAAGFTGNTGTGADFTVVKLDTNGNELWRRVINGSANGDDEARAVSVDGSGNVLAAGSLANSATGKDFFVVKFDASGNELWRYTLNGTANVDDQANGLAVDGSGNVFAAGTLTNTGTSTDFAVVKIAGATGAEVWRRVIDGVTGPDVANAVALDVAGNAFAVGEIRRGRDPNNNQNNLTTLIVKFDGASGNELWRDSNSLLFNPIGTTDHANAVTIDAAGNPVLVGQDHWSDTGDVHNSILVQKYDGSTGTVLFRRLLDGHRHGEGFSLALDSGGNIYVAGELSTTQQPTFDTQEFAVVKYGSSTTINIPLWTRTITANGLSDAAFGIAVDAAGNPIAVGTIESLVDGTDENFFTVAKLDAASGGDLWVQFVSGTAGSGANAGQAVALDSSGDVLAVGYLQNAGGRLDFSVVKLDHDTGNELWRTSIKGDGDNNDQALAIAVDASGNPIAAGYIVNRTTGQDFAVVKFDGATGTELWRKIIDGRLPNELDQANAVAVDGQGNVIAAGFLSGAGGGDSFFIVKLDGATGNELWRLGIFSGQAMAVAVDSRGDVAVVGNILSTSSVVKLSGANGAILWRQDVGIAKSVGEAHAIAIDSAGNVVAGGFFPTSSEIDYNTFVKYNGATGAEMWRQTVGAFRGNHLTLDVSGNVFIAGAVAGSFAVGKFDGASGTELWRNGMVQRPAPTAALRVSVDSFGDVVAVGNNFVPDGVTQASGSYDMRIVKFDPGSGAVLWNKFVNGSAAKSDDFGLGVALDGSGNVVAVGVTEETGTGSTFAVVMLNGTDGSDFTGGTPSNGVQPVVWTHLVNATANGNSLQKTGGCAWCDDAGAVSVQTIASGDGYMEFTASEMTTSRAVGLSNGDTDQTRTDIDFAVMMWKTISGVNYLEVYETGVWKAGQTYQTGDVIRVAVQGGVVQYSKNGTLWYTSGKAPVYPLLVDTSLWDAGATISNVMIAGAGGSPPPPLHHHHHHHHRLLLAAAARTSARSLWREAIACRTARSPSRLPATTSGTPRTRFTSSLSRSPATARSRRASYRSRTPTSGPRRAS